MARVVDTRVRQSAAGEAGGWAWAPVGTEDAAATAKTIVVAAVIDLADTQLPESGCAHDARFDCHVERRPHEWILRGRVWSEAWVCEDGIYGFELCVTRRLTVS